MGALNHVACQSRNTRYSYAELILPIIKENGSISWIELNELIQSACDRLGLILPQQKDLAATLTALEAAGKIHRHQVHQGRRGRSSYPLWYAKQ